MNAKILTIRSKVRRDPLTPTTLNDFQYEAGEAIDPATVLQQPNISLYGLDPENKRVIFVETPPGVDLSSAAFYYQAQYENARRLISLSYEALHALAGKVHIDPSRIVLLYSTGRCGSTLVSHAFNQAGGVASLSEPDVFTQILLLRKPDGSNDAEISELVRSCTKVTCALATQVRGASTFVLKFRSFVIELGDLFYRHFPEARVIFLYRNAEGVVRSLLRLLGAAQGGEAPSGQQEAFDLKMAGLLVPTIAAYASKGVKIDSLPRLLTCMWLAVMERCLALQAQGVPMFAARYEDLNRAPREVLEAMFDWCGVSLSNPEALLALLEKDSQAGTRLSRERASATREHSLEGHMEELRRFIRAHAPGFSPDMIVPGTFGARQAPHSSRR